MPWQAYAFVGLSLVAGGVLTLTYLRPLPADIGRPFTYAQIIAMPEWWAHGRFNFFTPDTVHYYFGAPISGLALSVPQAVLAAMCLLATVLLFRRAIVVEAWGVLVGGMLLFGLAHLLLFRLYFPNRYVAYAFPVFGIL